MERPELKGNWSLLSTGSLLHSESFHIDLSPP